MGDNARRSMYRMENWIKIKFDEEYDSVWDRIYSILNFKPSANPEDWPSFKEPKPYITYDISDFFDSDFAYEEYHEKGLSALRECTDENEYIYALDWHHTCYLFNPWKDFVRWNDHFQTRDWPIPLFPCGDYYLFLPKDFRWGILTHPWERTICIFGQDLIKGFEKHRPVLFNKILRSSGMAL